MTLIIIIYIIGYITALILIGVSNRNRGTIYTVSVEEAFVWSLLSWILVFLIILIIVVRHLTQLQTFKTFKDYFEGRSR